MRTMDLGITRILGGCFVMSWHIMCMGGMTGMYVHPSHSFVNCYMYFFQFKELNSKLNKEVAEFEQVQREGTHHLMHKGDVYEPSSELEAEAHAHVLGGGGFSSLYQDESREERRRRMLDATMSRLRKEEEELEQSCGTAGPSQSVTEAS